MRDDDGVVQFFAIMGIALFEREDLNGFQLICLAESASRAMGNAGEKLVSSFFRGLRDRAGDWLNSASASPESVAFNAALASLRKRADEAWQRDGGEAMLVE